MKARIRPFFVSSHRNHPVYRKGSGLAAVQPNLIPDPLEERLKDEPFVVALREFVDQELGEELRRDFSRSGGYAYDPASLFCIWIYGLLNGIRSSRKLEEACRWDLRYEYLARSCRPDHSTLSRFRRVLEGQMNRLFKRVAERALREGFLSGRVAVMDGTKIAAVRSQWRRRIPEAGFLEDAECDAETMQLNGKCFFGYNVQVAADLDSGMVLGVEATNCPNDLSHVETLMRSVERQAGFLPESAIADKGFSSMPNAHALDSRNVVGYLPPMRSAAPFSLESDGTFRCPAGKIPKERYRQDRRYDLHYRSLRVNGCMKCPLAAGCGRGKGHSREMDVPMGRPVGDLRAANLRALDPACQSLMRARAPSIERLFATLKWCRKFNRFLLRSKHGANLEFGLAALAHNIQRLLWAFFALLVRLMTKNAPRKTAWQRNFAV